MTQCGRYMADLGKCSHILKTEKENNASSRMDISIIVFAEYEYMKYDTSYKNRNYRFLIKHKYTKAIKLQYSEYI